MVILYKVTSLILSWKGNVILLNTLALCLLIYISSVVDTPDIVIEEVHNIITDFLWKGKMNKCPKNVIIKKIENGDLKFPDFESRVKFFKLSWINRLHLKPKQAGNWYLCVYTNIVIVTSFSSVKEAFWTTRICLNFAKIYVMSGLCYIQHNQFLLK